MHLIRKPCISFTWMQAYSFGSGLMECLAPGDTNLASRKQRKDYSKENSTEAPVTAVFGR